MPECARPGLTFGHYDICDARFIRPPANSERTVWALVKLGQVIARRLLNTGGAATPRTHTTFGGGYGLASGVKQLRRWASVPKPPDAYPNFPTFAFAVQTLPGHLVCSFVRISGRDKPRVLLLATATAARLNLVSDNLKRVRAGQLLAI